MVKFIGVVMCVLSLTAQAEMRSQASFHAKFQPHRSELHISVPTEIIAPTLQAHYDYLSGRALSPNELNLYLEMYLRETVKLRFGAFPMALGESGIFHDKDSTKLVMKLAKLPKSARELLVEISSFNHNPKQKNVFQITQSFNRQTFALSGKNAFTANISL